MKLFLNSDKSQRLLGNFDLVKVSQPEKTSVKRCTAGLVSGFALDSEDLVESSLSEGNSRRSPAKIYSEASRFLATFYR